MLRRGGTGSPPPISAARLGVGERTLRQGDRRPRPDLGVGGARGGVRGSPRVRLSARAVWANSRPSCGVSISASSADSLLQSRSSASRLPMDTARGSARSWGTGGRSGLPPPTTGSQAPVVPRAPRSAPVNPQELRVLSRFGRVWLFAAPWAVTHQGALSAGFSRQEERSGWPCPPPGDRPGPGMEPASPTSPALALAGRFLN